MGGEGEKKAKPETGGGGKEGAETAEIGGDVAIIFLIKKYKILIYEKKAQGNRKEETTPALPKKSIEIGRQKKSPQKKQIARTHKFKPRT